MQKNESIKKDLGLSDLLKLLCTAAGADAALISTGSESAAESIVLASQPYGLAGRRLPLSAGLIGACGLGVHPTNKLLLPSAMTGWLGFRPGFVASLKMDLAEAEGCLFFWWKERPNETPELASHLQQAARVVGDFAARQNTAAKLLQMQERLDATLRNVGLGIVFVDLLQGSLVNPVAAEFLRIPATTSDTASVVAAMQRTRSACLIETSEGIPLALSVTASDAATAEYWIDSERKIAVRVESHSVGSAEVPGRFWVFTDVKPLWNSSEKVKAANDVLERNVALLAEEMERRMEAEAELRKYSQGLKQQNEELEIAKLESDLIANQDGLTGLANRRRFRRGLDDMVADARQNGSRVAVLYLDLDKFKAVNDTLGHERGDLLLRTVSETLVKVLRKDDLIARLGGDEFGCAMSLPAGTDIADVTSLVVKLAQRLNIPVQSPGETIHVSASIGMAIYPDDANDAVSLLRAADNAMYLGKRQGGNEVIVFTRRNDAVSSN